MPIHVNKLKVSFDIAQYPVLRTAQSAFTLYFPGRPVQSYHLNFSGKHPATCYT
jgi:hypothetical protein